MFRSDGRPDSPDENLPEMRITPMNAEEAPDLFDCVANAFQLYSVNDDGCRFRVHRRDPHFRKGFHLLGGRSRREGQKNPACRFASGTFT
jgi:hypothetical protein